MTSSQGRNLRMIRALCSQGIMKFTTKRGSYNSVSCKNRVRELICSLRDREIENPVIVCDNASCHSGLEQIFTGKEFRAATLLRLGPYSPALNPVEGKHSRVFLLIVCFIGVWSILKSYIKTYMRQNYQSMLQ